MAEVTKEIVIPTNLPGMAYFESSIKSLPKDDKKIIEKTTKADSEVHRIE